jgi:hypothetical protein
MVYPAHGLVPPVSNVASSSPAKKPAVSGLMRLPAEIQLQILQNLCAQDDPKGFSWKVPDCKNEDPLLVTKKDRFQYPSVLPIGMVNHHFNDLTNQICMQDVTYEECGEDQEKTSLHQVLGRKPEFGQYCKSLSYNISKSTPTSLPTNIQYLSQNVQKLFFDNLFASQRQWLALKIIKGTAKNIKYLTLQDCGRDGLGGLVKQSRDLESLETLILAESNPGYKNLCWSEGLPDIPLVSLNLRPNLYTYLLTDPSAFTINRKNETFEDSEPQSHRSRRRAHNLSQMAQKAVFTTNLRYDSAGSSSGHTSSLSNSPRTDAGKHL